MTTIASGMLTVAMLAAIILAIGGLKMIRRDRQRGVLMIVAAMVLVGNVLVWTV